MKYLIIDGEVVNPAGQSGILDVLIDHGRIQDVGPGLKAEGATVIDAKGMHVLPGLTDMHCHLREPGMEYKEDIASGTRSAVAGGFTSVACMPNTEPVCDNESTVQFILQRAAQETKAKVYPIASVTKGMEGKELTEMGALAEAGAVAFSDDGKPVENANMMRNALLYAAGLGQLVLSHCEDLQLVNGGYMNEGDVSTATGLRGIPRAAEESMLAREVILAETYDVPIHICHVSTALGVDLIRQAKARGAKVTCETCPHYFTLTDEACRDFDTNAKMNPPLRTQADVDAIIAGLQDGTIDAIVTDHAPHHVDDKNVEFAFASNGITGFETALALAWDRLVTPGHIDAHRLVELMAVTPSGILGIESGVIAPGKPADLTLFNKNEYWTVEADKLYTKGKNTPFLGRKMTGRVKHVFVDGALVVKDNEVVEG